uniref:(California timema) hypothetical protein n=1 Tax=Timema californicum TaxID=61474 RepID=A0A7R9J930_TIMCA|nr:unnamed protein product [Timema californicum]
MLSSTAEDGEIEVRIMVGFAKIFKEENMQGTQHMVAKSVLEWCMKYQASLDGSDSCFNASGHGHVEYWTCEGNQLLCWKQGGYNTVIDLLTRKLPDPQRELPVTSKVLLNKEVSSISWDHLTDKNSGRVVTECADGSLYVSEHVIITTSLGVLKERVHAMFHPALPHFKITAIKGLGIGVVDKIFLKFPHRWWPKEGLSLNFLWTEKDTHSFNSKSSSKQYGGGKSWLQDVYGFHSIDSSSTVLLGWVIGRSARIMERLPETEVLDGCMELLHRFCGKAYNIPKAEQVTRAGYKTNRRHIIPKSEQVTRRHIIPKSEQVTRRHIIPKSEQVTRQHIISKSEQATRRTDNTSFLRPSRSIWGTNPHFLGCYSYRSVDSDVLGVSASQLASPVVNSQGKEVLLFAGEATSDHHYSTVHGAIETGFREADRLASLYSGLKMKHPMSAVRCSLMDTAPRLGCRMKRPSVVRQMKYPTIFSPCKSSAPDNELQSTESAVNNVRRRESMFQNKKDLFPTSSPHHVGFSCSTQSCDVVIVGAGVAGLAAARTLLHSSIHNCVLLEDVFRLTTEYVPVHKWCTYSSAQCCPGGRILSIPLDDEGSWIEMGAQWVHGEGNAVWELAHQRELLSDIISAEGEGLYLREDGVAIPLGVIQEVSGEVARILEECENFALELGSQKDHPCSIGQHLNTRFRDYLDHCDYDEEGRQQRLQLLDWHSRFHVIDNSCTRLDQLSAKAFGNYCFTGGKDYMNFKHGYSSLVQSLVDDLPSGMLRLNCPVEMVDWQGVSIGDGELKSLSKQMSGADSQLDVHPVSVTCCDGSRFVARHVIVTCSLGYLKENHRTMFRPNLPTTMVRAIEDMGFDTINKIFLVYKDPWWSSDIRGFQLIWSRHSAEHEAWSWVRDLTGFDVSPNHRAVLLGWIGGRGAEVMEDLSEEEVGKHCTQLLKRFTQRSNIPSPSRIISGLFNKAFIKDATIGKAVSALLIVANFNTVTLNLLYILRKLILKRNKMNKIFNDQPVMDSMGNRIKHQFKMKRGSSSLNKSQIHLLSKPIF